MSSSADEGVFLPLVLPGGFTAGGATVLAPGALDGAGGSRATGDADGGVGAVSSGAEEATGRAEAGATRSPRVAMYTNDIRSEAPTTAATTSFAGTRGRGASGGIDAAVGGISLRDSLEPGCSTGGASSAAATSGDSA